MRARLLALTLIIAAAALAGSPDRFAYVYKRGDDSILRVNGSLDHYLKIAKRWSGEFIWAEIKGRQYLIRDAAVLAEAQQAFAPMNALGPALRAAEEKVRPLEERYDAMQDHDEDNPALPALERQLQAAEREAERLDEEMERREAIAEAKFEKIVLRAIETDKAKRVD